MECNRYTSTWLSYNSKNYGYILSKRSCTNRAFGFNSYKIIAFFQTGALKTTIYHFRGLLKVSARDSTSVRHDCACNILNILHAILDNPRVGHCPKWRRIPSNRLAVSRSTKIPKRKRAPRICRYSSTNVRTRHDAEHDPNRINMLADRTRTHSAYTIAQTKQSLCVYGAQTI